MGAAGADLAPEAAPRDHERIGKAAKRRLGSAVREEQPALELSEGAEAPAAQPSVGEPELVDPAHSRRAPRDVGGLLEVAVLASERDARERVRRVGLIAELRVVD